MEGPRNAGALRTILTCPKTFQCPGSNPQKRAIEARRFTTGPFRGSWGPDWIEANISRKWSGVIGIVEGHHHNPRQIDRRGKLILNPDSFGGDLGMVMKESGKD
jgi:hypothetical protein